MALRRNSSDSKNLAAGHVYTITEGSNKPEATPFRQRALYSNTPVTALNAPTPADTWLMEPVPTPDRRKGAGFVLLYAGQKPATAASLPLEFIDVNAEKPEIAATYSLFRRYLFEYRTDLQLPLTILIDSESRARRIYANVPSEATMRSDLKQIERSRQLALPFPGKYYSEPRRNYFKLGAAFYWAGYPDRALPYLEETLRTRPDNWKALLAIGRIQQELNRRTQAAESLRGVLALRPDCADAANQLGILSAEANDLKSARQWFERAISAQRDHPGAINNLAVLYAKLGQPKDSIAAFRYGIQMLPDDDELYLNLARIYVTMGEREQARAVLTELMDHKPASEAAAKALAQLEGR